MLRIFLLSLMTLAFATLTAQDNTPEQPSNRFNHNRQGGQTADRPDRQGNFPSFPGGSGPGGMMGFPGGPMGGPFMMMAGMGDISQFDVEFDRTPLKETDNVVTDPADSTSLYYVENQRFDTTVNVRFDGDKAVVTGDVDGVTVTADGADVKITAKGRRVVYVLTGKTESGSLHIKSDAPSKIVLNGLRLKSMSGEAIHVTGKAPVYLVITDGTDNYLEDQFREVEKRESAFPSPMMGPRNRSEGETEVVDGIAMRKAVNRSKDKTKSTVDGVIATTGLLAVSGRGSLSLLGHNKSGIKTKGHLVFRPGNVVNVEVTQGKGLNAKGDIRILGGVLNVDASSAGKDAVRSEESIYISGGRVTVKSAGGESSEGVEAKFNLVIDDGLVEVAAFDDAVNSGGNLIVNGGRVYAASVFNDALDANGNLLINGGTVVAVGGNAPECGLDANDEEGYELYINGGTVVVTGGTPSRAARQSRQASVICGVEQLDSGAVYSLENETEALMLFRSPRGYLREGSLLFSSPSLRVGESYTVCKDNPSVQPSDAFHGMWTDGRNDGTEIEVIDMLAMPYSQVGQQGGMMGGPPMGGFQMPRNGEDGN